MRMPVQSKEVVSISSLEPRHHCHAVNISLAIVLA